ncbi:MAG TPA: putative peptide modification system cyclase [Rudaea sp.]|nr:putative peptide modification system cyclase [Rudaea sp.]
MDTTQSEQSTQQPTPVPLLRTVVLCDLVDSTALTEQLGDRDAAQFMHRLDRQCRDLLARHCGREIDKTDGFLLLFERPIQAVAFAIDYQRLVYEFGQSEFLPLRARVGIHVGDVVLWENSEEDVARGAKPLELEGLIKPITARLMNLALPGQILLSGVAHTLANRAHHEFVGASQIQWRSHGRYLFKGVTEPMAVFEIGEAEIAPLRRPAHGGKAFLEVPWWRRPGMIAIETALLIAAVAVPVWVVLRSQPAIAFADRDWVVVGDLNNLTGKTILNESLENAFRLGLEQSPYVNVLSAMKTRDTIALMQRDRTQTRIDRAIGSEVAIRDGARALILPTVAEVGGLVRVTAEVIDPKTKATVYTESVDGKDIGSVLSSIDTIDKNLRLRLGEALASISKQSRPLDQVATSNLDALRAFSLGQHAYVTGNMNDALAYYQDAVQLDPKFATAHLVIARVLLNGSENSKALKEISRAATERERLSARDRMLVDAWQATLTSPNVALEKWRQLTNLYPDFFSASGPYAYYAWCANHYAEAIAGAKSNVAPQNANRLAGEYLLGILFLADDRYSAAVNQFQRASDAGFKRYDYYAEAFAAERQFERANDLLKQSKPSGIPADDLGTGIVQTAIIADQGKIPELESMFQSQEHEVENLGPLDKQRLRGIALGLRSQFGQIETRTLTEYAESSLQINTDNAIDYAQAQFYAAFALYVQAHTGDTKNAAKLLKTIDARAKELNEPTLTNLVLILEAELMRVGGHPDQAIAMLKPAIDGKELYITHLALLDAYASKREYANALSEANWLADHRGRAYAEYGAQQFMTAFNVVQSDLALLRAAELSQDLNETENAKQLLAKFVQIWPKAQEMPALAARLHTLNHRQ